jgi:hypothetical protein
MYRRVLAGGSRPMESGTRHNLNQDRRHRHPPPFPSLPNHSRSPPPSPLMFWLWQIQNAQIRHRVQGGPPTVGRILHHRSIRRLRLLASHQPLHSQGQLGTMAVRIRVRAVSQSPPWCVGSAASYFHSLGSFWLLPRSPSDWFPVNRFELRAAVAEPKP